MGEGRVWNTQLSSNTATAEEDVGAIRIEHDPTYGRRVYKYVQAASDTTVANGTALGYSDAYHRVVSSDRTDTLKNGPAGAGRGAITASYYGWIEIKGYHEAVVTDGGDDIVAGDNVILHATTDGVVDRMAADTAPTNTPLGVAVADDVNASDTVAVYLNCPE
jgi:hypothetical protein